MIFNIKPKYAFFLGEGGSVTETQYCGQFS